MPKSTAIISPNLGLYYDRPEINMSPKMLKDGLNFRIKSGVISSLNLGWSRFSTAWQLNGPVMLINSFRPQGATEFLMMATTKDIYYYDASIDRPVYLTPIYSAG